MSASLSFKDAEPGGRGWGTFRIQLRQGPWEGELSQAVSHGISIAASLRDLDTVISLLHSFAACCRWAQEMDPITSPCLWGRWAGGGRECRTTLNTSNIYFWELGIQVTESLKSHAGHAIQRSARTGRTSTAGSRSWGAGHPHERDHVTRVCAVWQTAGTPHGSWGFGGRGCPGELEM